MTAQQTGGAKPRQVDLPMRARHKARQFIVTLKAVKEPFGLIESPIGLSVGDLLMLQPLEETAFSQLQIYGKVARTYGDRHSYALEWEKVVSPTGISAMLEFMQMKLGMAVSVSVSTDHAMADGHMVYYDFKRGEVRDPATQGNFSPENTLQPKERGLDDFSAPTPGGMFGTMAQPLQAQPMVPKQENVEDVVEMFGVRLSRSSWEQLEKVQFTGHSPTGQINRKEGPTPPAGKTVANSSQKSKKLSKVSAFFHKVAEKLSNK